MARIHDSVLERVVNPKPLLKKYLHSFLYDFDVTYGISTRIKGSEIEAFLMKPSQDISQMFGFEKELLLLHSPYKSIQARTISIAEDILSVPPFDTRADKVLFGVISGAQDLEPVIKSLMTDNNDARVVIPFSANELLSFNDRFSVQNRFRRFLFDRDLFDMSQPISHDTFFFGRTSFVVSLVDSLRQGENVGLFGLRKMGKTSILFRLKNIIEKQGVGRVLYIDLQDSKFYQLRWWKLLEKIAVSLHSGGQSDWTADNASERFLKVVDNLKKTHRNKKFIIAFDEIEHIAPGEGRRMLPHWDEDFLHFWKTLRAIQNQNRHISFIVCGVNATVIETPIFSGHDNPLFNMAKKHYVPSFDESEIKLMVQTLGKYMGLRFDEKIFSYLKKTYGGHPMVVRQACSYVAKNIASDAYRPFSLGLEDFESTERERGLSLFTFVEQALSTLKSWYKTEYEMLSLLATGDAAGFSDFEEAEPNYAAHLRAYELVRSSAPPEVSMAVVADYLCGEQRRITRGKSPLLVPTSSLSDRQQKIGCHRNALEPKLRSFIARTLKAKFGLNKWFQKVTRCQRTEFVDKYSRLSAQDYMEQLYFSDLLTIIVSNWDVFSIVENAPSDARITKKQFEVIMESVNSSRVDAHAGDISECEADAVTLAMINLEKILDEYS